MDDLAGKYDRETQELASPDVEEGPSGIA
jgi:hypothetical protein